MIAKQIFSEMMKNVADHIKSAGNVFLSGLLIFIAVGIFTLISIGIGELINYSPWFVLLADICLVLGVRGMVQKFHKREGPEKIGSWGIILFVIILVNTMITIAVSMVHYWALLNLFVIVLLLISSFVFFSIKAKKE